MPASTVNKTGYLMKGAVDLGIQEATKNGFAQSINASVTDHGITFEVKEVVADPLRISMMIAVKDKNGKVIDTSWNDLDLYERANTKSTITLKDNQGNILKSSRKPDDRHPTHYWDSVTRPNEFMILGRELRSYFDDTKQIPDELIVEFDINELAKTKGSWKLSVPVDMRKAKAATTIQEINKTYTTPQGIKLDVKQITYAPSGVELVIDRGAKMNETNGYNYQLVNEQGAVLGAWDTANARRIPKDQSKVNDRVNWRKSMPITSRTRDFQYFYPIDVSKGMIFVLGSVYSEEPAAFSAKLDLDRIEKEPVTVEAKSDRFTFQKYVRKPDEVVDFEGIHYRRKR